MPWWKKKWHNHQQQNTDHLTEKETYEWQNPFFHTAWMGYHISRKKRTDNRATTGSAPKSDGNSGCNRRNKQRTTSSKALCMPVFNAPPPVIRISRLSTFLATSEITSDCANTTQVLLMSHGEALSKESAPTWSIVVSEICAITSMNFPVPAAMI